MGMPSILSDQQLKAWTSGEIENLRFDPVTSMLTYRLTRSEDRPTISIRVPDDRAANWSKVE